MSSHVYHEIYLHLNWHTKLSSPILSPELAPIVHEFIIDRCGSAKGAYFHGIGGTETHIHLAINIEPFVNISELVGDLKGACSREINKRRRSKDLQWQRGFGVVSFGKANLDWVLKYIAHQKEHHSKKTVNDRLERVSFDDDGAPLADA